MWRTVCRSSNAIRSHRFLDLLTLPTFRGTDHAPYHSTKTLLKPKDTGFKAERVRRSTLRSSGQGSRFAHPASKTSGPEIRSETEGRVSSELQKLSLEDLGKPDPKLQKLNKKSQKQRDMNTSLSSLTHTEMVFGVTPCLLALAQGRRKPARLFVKRSEGRQRESIERVCEEAVKHGVPIQHVTKKELENMTNGAVHQGLCLQASPLGFVTKERLNSQQRNKGSRNSCPLWLVLDGVQDPMNFGSILRSAYFLGVDQVASSIRNSCPLSPVVSKASSGVMELMEVHGYHNLAEMLKVKLRQGWQAIGTVGCEEAGPGASVVPCSDFRMSKPTLLLMGGEGSGLSPELRELCDVFLTVPARSDLHPAVDSLNVSVATGILLHSLLCGRT
ncbi:rRNA methyltransferase 1, mitochondrial [Trichomycterus rosablanca]|uniref:rRNA methyltransferase 1, mitochondrial n=1 Tax=Trichomycterus rosablanca TaxID=2290929 RepID=UPI002F351543